MELIKRNLWRNGNGKACYIPSWTMDNKMNDNMNMKKDEVHLAVLNEKEYNMLKNKKKNMAFDMGMNKKNDLPFSF